MRICYVAFQFWPSIGGSQAQVERQARCLRQLGQEVIVVTLRHQKVWLAREVCATFPVIRIGGWYRRDGTLRVGRLGHVVVDIVLLVTLWRLRRSYDLIHTLQLSPLAVVATMIGKLTGKPVIIGIQSTGLCEQRIEAVWEEKLAQTDRSAVEEAYSDQKVWCGQKEQGGDIATLQKGAWGGRWMLGYVRKSDAYYQILSTRSSVYLMRHGFCPERLAYIPNGVDTQQFYPVWQARRVEASERIVLCVARLEYAKGVDVLLQAWAHLLRLPATWRDGLQLRLCLAGDGSCRVALERLARALGVQESVEFLGERHDICQLLHKAWSFVLPSRWEGMPNALLEAMACGLPCIASRVSGSEDVIEQGRNGLLVEPGQSEPLAKALRLLIEDTNLARELGWRGYETVRGHYQLSSTVQRCLAFYRSLLSQDMNEGEIFHDTQNIHAHLEE